MPIPTPEERVGRRLAGRYRVDRILGEGGFGVVYAGVHEWTGRPIAAKVLSYDLASRQEYVTRFLQEARVAARLSHPHVVDVLDMGQDEDGTVYLILEYLDGQDLAHVLGRKGKLTLDKTVAYVVPVMDALAEAHDAGIVHRDLKPANIFLSRDKQGRVVPKLLDFGIAKVMVDGLLKTVTGQVYGTPHYMSPEQAAGMSDLGPPADVWAMGVVLFQCLTGELPYPKDDPEAPFLLQVLSRPPPPIRSVASWVPEPVARVLDRALRHERADRYPNMGEMLGELVGAAREVGAFPPHLEALLDRQELPLADTALEMPGSPAPSVPSSTAPMSDRGSPSSIDLPPTVNARPADRPDDSPAVPDPHESAPVTVEEAAPGGRGRTVVLVLLALVATGVATWVVVASSSTPLAEDQAPTPDRPVQEPPAPDDSESAPADEPAEEEAGPSDPFPVVQTTPPEAPIEAETETEEESAPANARRRRDRPNRRPTPSGNAPPRDERIINPAP